MSRSDNSSLRQKLTRLADSKSAAPAERLFAERKLMEMGPETNELTADDILRVDDSAYGETESQFVKRTAPKVVKVGRRKMKVKT